VKGWWSRIRAAAPYGSALQPDEVDAEHGDGCVVELAHEPRFIDTYLDGDLSVQRLG
jgi:hypothetical protein